MQFIDESKIYIKAGNGGNGAVSFRREKFIERGGPDGGDGGDGGSVIFRSNGHLNTLLQFRFKRNFIADGGKSGKSRNKSGKSSEDLILEVPVGTQIFSEDGLLLIYDFAQDNQEYEIIQGGRGGLGNAHFKSSTNKSPRLRTDGEIGEEMYLSLKLKLLADAGLIGLPNVGKSTFLSMSSAAKPKIADYPFTTLKPGLGVVHVSDEEFVLADIPGLIEGAHEGSGLGDRFLKHIERCGVLLHIIDATNEDIIQDYTTIRNELELYSPLLKEKTEIICINKIDSISDVELEAKVEILRKHVAAEINLISGYTGKGIDAVLKKTLKAVREWQNPDE